MDIGIVIQEVDRSEHFWANKLLVTVNAAAREEAQKEGPTLYLEEGRGCLWILLLGKQFQWNGVS